MLNPKYASQSGVVANYDYKDIAEGTGRESYYGCTTTISGSTTYFLASDVLWSSLSGSTVTNHTTYNFDTPQFNTPRTVQGTGYASFELQNGAGASGLYVEIQLQKWDGTSAVNITPVYTTASLPLSTSKVHLIKLVCAQTGIKTGEQIRFALTAHVPGGASDTILFHNPKNQSGGTDVDTTVMEIGVPFRLDL